MENAIEVKGLRKIFAGPKGAKTEVLRGVDFNVRKGEIFALLGSNGAGKTTTINILSTLLKSDEGTATVNGFDLISQPEKVRRSISLTGQFAAVDEILTGRENIILIAKLRNIPKPAQLADSMLKRFGLTDAANRPAGTYSGGMKRRLDIAMSLVGEPAVIFLDEPTTGLDPEGRLEVWKTVKELADGGTTILLTTQYLEEAEQLAGRIAILHDGKIIANGTLEELKKLFPSAKVEYIPFLSSAFVPTETMPTVLRVFAENQPVTSIVNSIRALLSNEPVGNEIWIALAWCVGIIAVAWFFAMRAYKSRI